MSFLEFKPESHVFQNCILSLGATMLVIFGLVKFIKNRRANQRRPRLAGEEVSQVVSNTYGSIKPRRGEENVVHDAGKDNFGERRFAEENYCPDYPRWFL